MDYYEDLRFNRLISNNRFFPYREEKIYNYPFLVLTDKDGKTSTNILIRLSGEFKIFLSRKILTIQVLPRIFNYCKIIKDTQLILVFLVFVLPSFAV